MSIYLGNLGRLVELKGPSSQSVAADDGYTFKTTLEKRVKAQAKTKRPRQWSVDIGAATPADLANLLAFAGGEWGVGPFVWVSVDAPVTNMLTPEVSTCGPAAVVGASVSVGPAVSLGGGAWAGRSLINSDPSATLYFSGQRFPVIQGVPVTGSAWLLGAGSRARLHWYGADGAGLGTSHTSSAAGLASSFTRLSVTAMPLAGAVACGVSAVNTVQAARPAMTWTDRVFDWQPGEGCQKAVIHGLSKNVLLALRDPNYGRYSNASFTITEVG